MFHKMTILGLVFLLGCSSAQGGPKNEANSKQHKPKPLTESRAAAKVPVVLAKDTAPAVPHEARRPVSEHSGPPVINDCFVGYIDDVDVAAQEAGMLMEMTAKEGVVVKKGQAMGRIDDRLPRAQLYLAKISLDTAKDIANDDISLRFSKAQRDVAAHELRAALEANKRRPGTIGEGEIRRLRLELKRAELSVEKAIFEQRQLKYEVLGNEEKVAVAKHDIIRRQMTAPVDGVVLKVRRHPGEWVNAGETVLRIVRMDRLRIEGFLKADQHAPEEVIDRDVEAEVELPRGRTGTFKGKITFVSPEIQAGGEYRVKAEFDNRRNSDQWVLQPGLRAKLTIVE